MGVGGACVAAVLAVAVGAAGCTVAVQGTPAADPAALSRPAPSTRPPGAAFRDAAGRFDIVPPPGWTVDAAGAQDTAVVFADPVPSESPAGRFRANINVILVPAVADLPGTVTGARQEVRALAGYRSTADEPVTLADGSPAHLLGGTFDDPETGFALRNVQLLAVRDGADTVVVTGTALADTWDGYAVVFETSLRSLVVVI